MADEVAGELDRLFKQSRWQADDDLVFAAPHTGEPPYKPGILKRYRKALVAAQLEESHVFHDLRHTFGTRMAAAGVPIRTLQNGSGIATSARRSATPITRRAAAKRRWSRPRSLVGPFVGPI